MNRQILNRVHFLGLYTLYRERDIYVTLILSPMILKINK